ncbi:hypothetical protein ACFW21_15815, partial [Streptomyces albogriseolus]
LGLASSIDAPLARDGVDEFLVNLPYATPFAPGVARLRAADQTIRFRCVRARTPRRRAVRALHSYQAVRSTIRAGCR